jgi:hypothetical protein
MKYRIKTKAEFKKEYGKTWRETILQGYGWDDEMDYLFGLPIPDWDHTVKDLNVNVDDWTIAEWMVTPMQDEQKPTKNTFIITPELTRPDYYRYTIKGIEVDVIDIATAMKLPFTLGLALKYFRIKGDKQKQINDLEKAIECINRQIKNLKQ